MFNKDEEHKNYKRKSCEKYSRLRKYLKHRERESAEAIDKLNSELLRRNSRIKDLTYQLDFDKTRSIEVLQNQICSLKKQLEANKDKDLFKDVTTFKEKKSFRQEGSSSLYQKKQKWTILQYTR